MKLSLNKLSPKRLFSSKPRNSVSKSDPASYSHNSSSSSDTTKQTTASDLGTPTSVLPDTSLAWFDADNIPKDIVLTRTQLKALLTRLVGSTDVAEMLSEVDDDEMISLDALVARVGGGGNSLAEAKAADDAEMRGTFEFFDTDRDGKITAEELLGVFTTLGDERCSLEDCKRMIAGVDKNGDGFVCFDDFCVMMMMEQQQQR